ncbi:MAG: DUF4197 domain-containing protein [Desulfobacterales bacterium]|jgi:hypothetical protein
MMAFKILIPIVCIFCIINVGDQVNAGFQDFIKDALKTLGVEKGLTNDEIVKGLKQALEIGTGTAVEMVSKPDGYFKNPLVKIPLPENIKKVEKLLRATGFGNKVDEFELSMNRAAERATPEAKNIFWDAIKQMTFTDAREILDGQDDAATMYFKDKTSERLQEIFKPITHQAMSEVGTTSYYQSLDAKIKTIPFAADQMSFDLDQYVTDKALDGLFLMLAKEEKKIRHDPEAQVTDLLKKVFGSQ